MSKACGSSFLMWGFRKVCFLYLLLVAGDLFEQFVKGCFGCVHMASAPWTFPRLFKPHEFFTYSAKPAVHLEGLPLHCGSHRMYVIHQVFFTKSPFKMKKHFASPNLDFPFPSRLMDMSFVKSELNISSPLAWVPLYLVPSLELTSFHYIRVLF